jgi:exodeoxyribonuclease V gamma subunit
VAAIQHPVRAFLRQRLGLTLRSDDERPADALPVELDGLQSWAVGDRILARLLAGEAPDAVCAAEVARGLLPPGELGRAALARARLGAEVIAGVARSAADGPRRSLEVDVALPDGRQLVGALPDVVGDTVRTVTYSRLGPRPRLRAWVHHLAATASHPDRALRTVTVGRDGKGAATFEVPPIDAADAVALLVDLVGLRDEALRQPLPLYCDTSHAFAAAERAGRADPLADAAPCWASDRSYPKEDQDASHVLVLGGVRAFEEVAGDPRFGVLARRLWEPVFATSGARTP